MATKSLIGTIPRKSGLTICLLLTLVAGACNAARIASVA